MTTMVAVWPQPCPSVTLTRRPRPGAIHSNSVQPGWALAGASPWLHPSSQRGGGTGLSWGPLDPCLLTPDRRARAHLEARLRQNLTGLGGRHFHEYLC